MPALDRCVKPLLTYVTVTQPTAVEGLTAVIAARVRELRRSSGISQAELGERMTNLGYRWGRTSVQKLETGGRAAVSAGELFALAALFDVPVPWMVIDPMAVSAVPIAGRKVAPWLALMWLTGRVPLAEPPGAAWGTAAPVIALGHQIAAVTERHAQLRAHREIVAALLPGDRSKDRVADDERQERRTLEDLARVLTELRRLSYPAPLLPGDVIDRATALGVELPGVDRTVEPEGGERDG